MYSDFDWLLSGIIQSPFILRPQVGLIYQTARTDVVVCEGEMILKEAEMADLWISLGTCLIYEVW
jgi:hypothetical protein